MPKIVSTGTFDNMTSVASVCLVGSDAMTFFLAALDGTIPKLSQAGYCSSLFRTEAGNLDAMGKVDE